MTRVTRLGPNVSPRTEGRLIDRTERLIRMYDEEPKDFAFWDSGDAESYAAEMADLLEQWTEAYRASLARHPAARQNTDEIFTPSLPSIEDWRRWRHERGDQT
jgi:hypothetical protein